MGREFDRSVLVGIALLATMIVGVAATSYANTRDLRDDAGRATHSRQVIDAIATVRTAVRKVQADQRAYLITGFPEWVAPYTESCAVLRSDADRLLELTVADPEQHDRAAAARREIETGLTGLDGVVLVRGTADGHAAIVALSRERGRQSFVDPLLGTLDAMERAEAARLDGWEGQAREAYNRTVLYGSTGAALGLIALALFVAALRRAARVRAAAAAGLADQKELLDATLTSIGDGVIATDAAGNVTFLNKVAEALTGWPHGEARGQPLDRVFNIVNETTRGPVENPALRALKAGVIVGLANHTVLIARDGTERPIDDSAAPIRSRGTVTGAVLVFRDITERKAAEDAARASDARNRFLLDLAAATQPLTDPAAIVAASARLLAGHLGADRCAYAEVEAESVYVIAGDHTRAVPSIVGRWDVAAFGAEHLRTMLANEPYVVADADADPRIGPDDLAAFRATTIRAVICVPLHKGGRLTAAMAVQQTVPRSWTPGEVTLVTEVVCRCWEALERARVDRALRASEERFRTLFEAMDEGYCVVEPVRDGTGRATDYRYLLANPALEVHTGLRDVVGRTAREVMPSHESHWIEAYARVAVTGEPFRRTDRVIDLDRVFEVSAFPVGAGLVGVLFSDVTSRWRAEEAVRVSEERYRTLFTSIDQGFCVVELLYDGDRPVDYRFLEANPMFVYQTGLVDPVGRTIRELVPDIEGHWPVIYARVAATGESARFVEQSLALGRWFDVFASRVGGPDSRTVAILFSDITARRDAEAERERLLREVETERGRLAEAFRNAPSFMAVVRGPGHVFERANDRYVDLVGGRELIGRSVGEALPEVVGQGFIGLLDAVYASGDAYVGTGTRVLLERGEGPDEERFLDFVYEPLRDAGGAVTGILVQGIDLTARRRAEAALRERDERLQVFLGAATDYAVVISDADGRVVEWIGGAAAITGYAAAEAVGHPAGLLFTPEDRAAGVPDREMATAAGEGRAEDKRWHQKQNGDQFYADGVMVPLRDDAGRLRGFGKVFRDATARKRAEDAVRFLADASASLAELVDYESTLRRIANIAVGGFADWCVVDVLDGDGKRRRLAATHTEPDEVASARAADAALPPSEGLVPHVLRTGKPEVVYDLTELDPAIAPQGTERVALLRAWGVRSYLCVPLVSRGRVIGGVTFLSQSARRRFGPEQLRTAQDLAERVTAAIENAQLYRDLQDQDRRKDEFLATLAHELRNPLAPVRNGVQILRAILPADERTARALNMMDRQLGHMVHLVDDLMDVARVSSGKVVLRKERLELRGVVEAAVETTRQAIEGGGHELGIELPDEPLVFEADRTRFVQVLANLLSNAAKYTPHGGRIVLSAERADGHAVVRVADTGVGIPAEMLPKVFDMFTQVGTSLERSQGGLGIGLTLVKRLTEMHGGTVSAESPGVDLGSTFTVRLPLAVVAPPAGELVPTNRPAAAHLAVLVVDDNVDAADSLALLLEMQGHEVRTAHDGPEALRVLGAYRPHLVVLDIGLPGMTGYEVARRIRESEAHRGVTLAALTGWGQEEDRRRSREAGFDHHLVKPVSPDEIQSLIGGLTRSSDGSG